MDFGGYLAYTPPERQSEHSSALQIGVSSSKYGGNDMIFKTPDLIALCRISGRKSKENSMPLPDMLVDVAVGSAEEILADSLEQCSAYNPNLKTSIKQIYFAWPTLHSVSIRLAKVIGNYFPDENKPRSLLAGCITDAVEAFQTQAMHDVLPPARFLQTIITRCAEGIASYDVYGVRGARSAHWELTECGLMEFASGWASLELVGVSVSKHLIDGNHLILASKLLTVDDAAMLSRAAQLETQAAADEIHSTKRTSAEIISVAPFRRFAAVGYG